MPVSGKKASFAIVVLFLVAVGAMPGCLAQVSNGMPPVKDENKIDPLVMRRRLGDRVKGFTQSPDVPSGFPAPIYTSGQINANYCISSGTNPAYAGTIMTKDSPMATYGWYKQNLSGSGWTINNLPQSKAQKEGKIYILSATKGDITTTVTSLKAKKGDFTIVNVSCFSQRQAASKKR